MAALSWVEIRSRAVTFSKEWENEGYEDGEQHYVMLQRNLLYTCITRAKKIMVLIGTKKALAMAIKNNRTFNRNTKLAGRISAQHSGSNQPVDFG